MSIALFQQNENVSYLQDLEIWMRGYSKGKLLSGEQTNTIVTKWRNNIIIIIIMIIANPWFYKKKDRKLEKTEDRGMEEKK